MTDGRSTPRDLLDFLRASAMEEILRYTSVIQHMARTVLRQQTFRSDRDPNPLKPKGG